MADTTTASQNLTQEDVAEELQALADELRGDETEIDVGVDNKSVTLAPPETIAYDIEVTEREPMLGDKRESISIDLHWQAEE